MTNAQIIFNAAVELQKAGVIKTTGRSFEAVNEDGEAVTIWEPEEIHTFAMWRELGRQVRRGEHAKATIYIWKVAAAKAAAQDEETGSDEAPEGVKMFQKKAFFFTIDQTDPIEEK